MIIINAVSLGCLNISKLDSGDWTGGDLGKVSANGNLRFCFIKVPEGQWGVVSAEANKMTCSCKA